MPAMIACRGRNRLLRGDAEAAAGSLSPGEPVPGAGDSAAGGMLMSALIVSSPGS